MVRSKLSINRQKVKATTSIKNLQAEMERTEDTAEFWDKKGRMIDTNKTSQNVVLKPLPKHIDQYRKGLIKTLNQERANLSDGSKATRARSRALRSDTVDLITSIVQPSSEFISGLPRDTQNQFFQDALQVMQDDSERYGRILGAVIHYDENTPHMQVVSSTLDFEQLKSKAKEMIGNQSKMSKDQTAFVEAVQAKGWAVERGVQRIDNPEYQNWADEKRAQGLEVNRYTDELIMKAEQEATERISEAHKEVSRQERNQADKFYRQFWSRAKKQIQDFSFSFQWSGGKTETATETTVKDHKLGLETAFNLINIGWQSLQNQLDKQIERILSETRKFIQDKQEEYAEIDSKVSNLRSESSELQSGINTLENQKEALEDELEGLERKRIELDYPDLDEQLLRERDFQKWREEKYEQDWYDNAPVDENGDFPELDEYISQQGAPVAEDYRVYFLELPEKVANLELKIDDLEANREENRRLMAQNEFQTKANFDWKNTQLHAIESFRTVSRNAFWDYEPEKITTTFGKETGYLKVSEKMWPELKNTVGQLFKENAELENQKRALHDKLKFREGMTSHSSREENLRQEVSELKQDVRELSADLREERREKAIDKRAWQVVERSNPGATESFRNQALNEIRAQNQKQQGRTKGRSR